MVSSLSPSGPPGPSDSGSSGSGLGLPFGPSLDVSSLSPSPTAINSLLYADDVAIIGSASEVKQMLDLAQIHSQVLGYRWSPTKCAILNAPDPASSRYSGRQNWSHVFIFCLYRLPSTSFLGLLQ
ncbi:hypothetical protein RO3G_16819 [Rhizopus delemar RA 99-880]|uniref:Reverse transcriptase domain-containing protein n=1 Tax=Rhizopus delemar (strain RA 99-880 / ATCC MYA-4621 / FGSC 9543 / NRRL 43880) TaxID=246409 RepID=I1CUH8_RHIO9|nr:hypothetical protein RO3G_16819 [Rhizopus delemar RA 99-880]|eukprot:EIE92108.1 hypothetical protein RO3G_16819 [Rhizopus delemar RA 99-880]